MALMTLPDQARRRSCVMVYMNAASSIAEGRGLDMLEDNERLLATAIQRREQVVGYYNERLRAFCPHALGRKGDKRHVFVYQFEAEGDGMEPVEGWRCLEVDKLTDLSRRPGEWYTATNVFNPQSCLDSIEVVVGAVPPRVRAESADLPVAIDAAHQIADEPRCS
jgi:hypothetical protein